jgi:gliding motility-associated-like protein
LDITQAIKQFKVIISNLLVTGAVLSVFFNPITTIAQSVHFDKAAGDAVSFPSFSTSGCPYTWTCSNPAIGLAASGTGDIPTFTAKNNTGAPITATITATPTGSGFAYIANSGSDNVSVINTTTHAVLPPIAVDNQPWGVAVSPDGRLVYVVNKNNQNGRITNSSLSIIDAATNTIIGSPITLGRDGGSIAISPDGKKAFVANKVSNQVAVVDLLTYSVSYINITYALAVAVSSDGKRLYVIGDSNTATGKLYVLDTKNYQYLATVDVGLGITGIVVSPDCNKVYLTNDFATTISVLDAATFSIKNINVGGYPFAITITPDGNTVYTANNISNSVSIINTVTGAVATLPIAGQPYGIAVSPNGKEVYVACQKPDQVLVMSTATNTFLPPIVSGGVAQVSIGNFVSAGIGCNNLPVTYTITVNPAPVILDPGGISSSLSTPYGTPSTAQTISVGGKYLTAGILVTAPAGFEISTDDITFSNELTIGSAGDVKPTDVFVRLKSTAPVGSTAGDILLSSPGANPVSVPVDGEIIKTPLIVTAEDKVKFAGDPNPVLTIKYTGFVNGEGPAQLTTQPVISTTATITSPVGKYPITVSGAVAANYTITSYVSGTLEILSGEIVAPNTFTPNGDGINDTWDIKYLNLYTGCTVEVINRFGNKIFQSSGYPVAWNGTYNNSDLPVGTYYYIIRLRNGARPITGYVAIIR